MPGDGERSSEITSITRACGQGFGGTGDAGVRRGGDFQSSVHGMEGKPLNVYFGWEETCSRLIWPW